MRILGIILAIVVLILIIWLVVAAVGNNNADQSDITSVPTMEPTETMSSPSPSETVTISPSSI